MLKQLLPIPVDGLASLDDEEEEDAYGFWKEYSLKAALEESRASARVVTPQDIWPNWAEGRPSSFRLRYYWQPFRLGRVSHRGTYRSESLELEWERCASLSSISANPDQLPPSDTYAWSGVYRIFRPNTEIARVAGRDPTGTIYIGKAGTGKLNWSILRTRVREAANQTHQATRHWQFNDRIRAEHPWEALRIEWAFTGTRHNSRGEEEPWATLAERWLLSTYRQSFGERPPLNDR